MFIATIVLASIAVCALCFFFGVRTGVYLSDKYPNDGTRYD